MKEASTDAELLTSITHALVLFIKSHEMTIIEVDNIKQFSGRCPKHCLQFLEQNIYHAKQEKDDNYDDVYIYTLGGKIIDN